MIELTLHDKQSTRSFLVCCTLIRTLERKRFSLLFRLTNMNLSGVVIYTFALSIPRWGEKARINICISNSIVFTRFHILRLFCKSYWIRNSVEMMFTHSLQGIERTVKFTRISCLKKVLELGWSDSKHGHVRFTLQVKRVVCTGGLASLLHVQNSLLITFKFEQPRWCLQPR